MLTAAALGMLTYGAYSAAWAMIDLIRGPRIELWAEIGTMLFGGLLALSAAFVRAEVPGGLALAVGALLGLQALDVYTSFHLGTGIGPQVERALLAALLVVMAHAASKPA